MLKVTDLFFPLPFTLVPSLKPSFFEKEEKKYKYKERKSKIYFVVFSPSFFLFSFFVLSLSLFAYCGIFSFIMYIK